MKPYVISFQTAQDLFGLLFSLPFLLFNINDGRGSHARGVLLIFICTCATGIRGTIMQTKTQVSACDCLAEILLLLFIIISAGPCSKMEWDWMVSARPRPLPLPLGPRPWSPSFFSLLGPLSTFDLTEPVSGQETGKPTDTDRIRLLIINSLFLNFPAYYVGRECFLQNKTLITMDSVLVSIHSTCYQACYLLYSSQSEVSRSHWG